MEDLKQYQNAIDSAKANATQLNQWGFLGNNIFGKILGYDSVMNNKQALLNSYYANAFNSAEAAKNRNFQERLSNTAYQRAAKDLGALGFSPLALVSPGNSAASSPSGYTASSSSGAGVHGSASSAIVSTILKALIGVGINSSIANANLAKAVKNTTAVASASKSYNPGNYSKAELQEIYRIVKTPWLDD